MSEAYKTPLETPLEVLGLSTRAYNALRRAGYETVEQVYYETDDVLSRKRDIGVVAMCEINHALEEWETAKHCGTCYYNCLDRESKKEDWLFCDNSKSDNYGCYTEYSNGCEEWEER